MDREKEKRHGFFDYSGETARNGERVKYNPCRVLKSNCTQLTQLITVQTPF